VTLAHKQPHHIKPALPASQPQSKYFYGASNCNQARPNDQDSAIIYVFIIPIEEKFLGRHKEIFHLCFYVDVRLNCFYMADALLRILRERMS
jgi:hypothetical protein